MMGTAAEVVTQFPQREIETMPRQKAADEGIDPRIRNIVYVAREVGLHYIVVMSLLGALIWTGPNIIIPVVKTFESGPSILTQQMEMNKLVLGMIQRHDEREIRDRVFKEGIAETLKNDHDILRRIQDKLDN